MIKQEIAPPPGIFARLIRLPNKRQALKRELCGVGETDTPAAYPPSIWLLCSMEVTNRFLEAAPGRGVRRPKDVNLGIGLTRCQQLGIQDNVS